MAKNLEEVFGGAGKKLGEAFTVSPSDHLRAALDHISDRDCWSILAAEKGVPVGIITERDILKLA
ncbi:MAG: CBS domain-containing protein [Nitrososphaerales archaeon]